MEHSYTAYTKTINNTEYYFVKKYSCFPELTNVPSILHSYGMHTNFSKACKIAGINDAETRQLLYKEAKPNVGYGFNNVTPPLSTSLRVELVNNKPSLVSKLSGIKRIIFSRIPHWRILSHS